MYYTINRLPLPYTHHRPPLPPSGPEYVGPSTRGRRGLVSLCWFGRGERRRMRLHPVSSTHLLSLSFTHQLEVLGGPQGDLPHLVPKRVGSGNSILSVWSEFRFVFRFLVLWLTSVGFQTVWFPRSPRFIHTSCFGPYIFGSYTHFLLPNSFFSI